MAMITTMQQHIPQQEQAALKAAGREASGTFSWLLSGITLAAAVDQ
jgi:fructose-1,6-bisphosphatase I